jgi:hypothetical protein
MSTYTPTLQEICFRIAERLRSRQTQIEEAIFDHLRSTVPDPGGDGEPEYEKGLRVAVTAGVDYSLAVIEHGEERSDPVPAALVAQARRAARSGVSIETVMRRVTIAERLIKKFAIEEAGDLPARVFDQVLSVLGMTIDRLTRILAEEYNRERERVTSSPDQRRIKLVQRLLVEDIDPLELKELDYEVCFPWHIGVIAIGAETGEILERVRATLRCKLLSVPSGDGTVWAWLGGHTKLAISVEFRRTVSANGRVDASLAVGEPRVGLEGWRETHREAQTALPIACHESGFTHCSDVLPVAAALQSKAIIRMYESIYILPMGKLHKGGQPARDALRAYFRHGRNFSSAASALDATRGKVEHHMNEARRVLGDSFNLTGLEVALRLEELGYIPCESQRDDP